MKILLYDMGAYTQNDMLHILKKKGIICKNVYYKFQNKYHDDFFYKRFSQYITADHYDCVMSINYFPIVARICHEHHIKYLSWCYDCPLNLENIESFSYETNYIFLFDKIQYENYRNKGYRTVYHLPLGIHVSRLNQVQISRQDYDNYSTEVSFVGQLYASILSSIILPFGDFDKGYIDAIIKSQLKIYGYYMIKDLITEDLLKRANQSHAALGQDLGINRDNLSFHIATHITHIERTTLLNMLGKRFKTKLYSREKTDLLSHVPYYGTVSYFDEMPKVFKLSKINLNPTLKCIESGIPLRALDILGSGGLLFSNYQPELADYFQSGVDVVMYDSLEDALEKADYYLSHEEERKQIANNGYMKAGSLFSFEKQLEKIFYIAAL